MSCMSQNFLLFHEPNSSTLNFRFFLLMYPGPPTSVSCAGSVCHGAADVVAVTRRRRRRATSVHYLEWRSFPPSRRSFPAIRAGCGDGRMARFVRRKRARDGAAAAARRVWLVVTGGHWWSLVVTGGHWWSLVVTGGHWRSVAVTGGHWWSLVVTGDPCSSSNTVMMFFTRIT